MNGTDYLSTRQKLYTTLARVEAASVDCANAERHYKTEYEALYALIDKLCPLPVGEPDNNRIPPTGMFAGKIALIKLLREVWRDARHSPFEVMSLSDAKDRVEQWQKYGANTRVERI